MLTDISTELIEAYSLCPRKAYLHLTGDAECVPHEYDRILKKRADDNRKRFIASLLASGQRPCDDDLHVTNNSVRHDGFIAEYDAILKPIPEASRAHARYEPYIVLGTQSVNKTDKLRLAFVGYVVGKMRRYRPTHGFVVTVNGDKKRVDLDRFYPTVSSLITKVREMIDNTEAKEPPLVLNEHCPVCQFRKHCRRQAEENDNLSVLSRMTSKIMRKYHGKGVFTVNQLSYLFRPS